MIHNKYKGITYASLGATFFGISSIVADILFKHNPISPQWLVSVRMILSGIILLSYLTISHKNIFNIWKNKNSAITIVIFGIFGVLFAQSSFLLTIFYGNAALATILQSLGPSFIIIILAIYSKVVPRRIDILAIILSLFGIILLVTNGNLKKLNFSGLALFWGILSALGVCAYTLIPLSLVKKHSPLMIVAWGLLIGGIFSNVFTPISKIPQGIDKMDLFLIFIIVVVGTILAYGFYINSLLYSEPHIVGMLSILEPVTSILISTIFLNISFLTFQVIGIILVFLSLALINYKSNELR